MANKTIHPCAFGWPHPTVSLGNQSGHRVRQGCAKILIGCHVASLLAMTGIRSHCESRD